MRNQRYYLEAKKEAKDILDAVVESTPEVSMLVKLYKAGFKRGLDRLIDFMRDDMNPFRDDAAIEVYKLIAEQPKNMASIMKKLRKGRDDNKSGGKENGDDGESGEKES